MSATVIAWHLLPLQVAQVELEVLNPVSVNANFTGSRFLSLVVNRDQRFMVRPCRKLAPDYVEAKTFHRKAETKAFSFNRTVSLFNIG